MISIVEILDVHHKWSANVTVARSLHKAFPNEVIHVGDADTGGTMVNVMVLGKLDDHDLLADMAKHLWKVPCQIHEGGNLLEHVYFFSNGSSVLQADGDGDGNLSFNFTYMKA